jgi:hypothetical protein
VTAAVWREKFLVRPAGNRTGDLSLMRRVWYHKTTASALGWLLANSRPVNLLPSQILSYMSCLSSMS